MKSEHRTHFLFIEPIYPPSVNPIEDELTEKVDFIFSTLKQSEGCYRGWHQTPFDKQSDYYDYVHEVLPLVSNSLATYYIRHHRKDISQKQMDWIHELYSIVQNPDDYYKINAEKAVYFFKFYERDKKMYGNVMTYAIKVVGTKDGVENLIKDTFFRELTENEFNKEIQSAKEQFEHQSIGCSSLLVYDVLKPEVEESDEVKLTRLENIKAYFEQLKTQNT